MCKLPCLGKTWKLAMLHEIWQDLDKVMNASLTQLPQNFPELLRNGNQQQTSQRYDVGKKPSLSIAAVFRCSRSSRIWVGAPGGPRGPRPVLRLLQQPLLRGGEQLARHHRQPPVPHLDVQKALPKEGTTGPYRTDFQSSSY